MWFGKIIVSKADQQLGVQCEGVVVMVSGLTRLETGCITKRSRDRLHEKTERHKGNGGENETQRFKVEGLAEEKEKRSKRDGGCGAASYMNVETNGPRQLASRPRQDPSWDRDGRPSPSDPKKTSKGATGYSRIRTYRLQVTRAGKARIVLCGCPFTWTGTI